ncbi:hypothetical protein [Streptomyces sp. NPDC002788]
MDSQSAADEMTARTASHFTTISLGLQPSPPLAALCYVDHLRTILWLALLNLIGRHVGLLVMARGHRDGIRGLKGWWAGIHAATLLLCLVVAEILQWLEAKNEKGSC